MKQRLLLQADHFLSTANDWVVSNKEITEKTKYTITGLTPGCKISVRVKAINKAGASAPRTLQHSVLVKEVVGELYKVCRLRLAVTATNRSVKCH